MTGHVQTYETFPQAPARGFEMWWLWAEVNQRVLNEMVTVSVGAAKEGIRLSAEIQLAAVEAIKDGQTFLLRRTPDLQEASRDPMSWYQRNMLEAMDGTQRAFKLVEGASQAVTRSAERVRTSAEQAAREIQSSFARWSDEVRSATAPAAQPPRPRGQKVDA